MSEVKRYGHIGYLVNVNDRLCELYPDMTVYVKASDYDSAIEDFNTVVRQKMAIAKERDAAQSDLAALREENKKVQKRYEDMTDCAVEFESAAESAELGVSLGLQREAALREELAELEEEFDTLEHSNVTLKLSLAAAEQRNATLTTLLREGLEEYKNGDDWIDRVIEALRGQPTESGASE